MNATSHSVGNLGQTLLHRTGASTGDLGERDKIVLGKHGFRASRKGVGRDVIRSIKHFFTGSTGATKNAKAWRGAAKALGISTDDPRIKAYIDGGKELTMRKLQKVLVNPKFTKKFDEDFGMDTITDKVQKTITRKFGEPSTTELQTYDSTLKLGSGNNGTYVKNSSGGGSFAEFHRMEHGVLAPDPRHEKVHLSVHPDDIGRAYEVLAPILNDPNSPIPRWKVVDINEARVDIIKLTDELAKETDPAKQQELQKRLAEAERLHDGAQFTIYAMPGQDGAEVGALVRQMEEALRKAGIRTTERPGSDEPLPNTDYSSFRIGSKTVEKAGVAMIQRIDPMDPGYAEFQATFKDDPFFLSLQ